MGVATGPAADVEDPLPGFEPQGAHQVVHLLHGPLGVRVPQVRPTEVVGDRLEPVALLVRRGTHPLASAHVGPEATLTSSGTRSSAAPRMVATVSGPTAACSASGTSSSTSSCTCRTMRLA